MTPESPQAGRFTAHDRTEIAYGVEGSGPPMVLTNGLTTTINFWDHLRPRWAAHHQLVTWDMPGHGLSGRARSEQSATLAYQPELLQGVLGAAGVEGPAIQVAWSTGCQVALELYRRYPERCRALVLMLGSAGHVLSTSDLPLPGPAIDWIVRHTPKPLFAASTRFLSQAVNMRVGRQIPRRLGLIGAGTTDDDAAHITAHLQRIDASTVQMMIASAQVHSAWDVLPTIEVPVFIVAGERDPFAPADAVGVRMHAQCPQAELLCLPDASHTALLDHADQIGDAVDDFLKRRVS